MVLGSVLNPIEPSLIPCYLPFKAFFSCLIRQRLKRLAIVFSLLHRGSTVAPAGHQIVDSRLDFPLQDHALVYLHSRDPNIHLEDGCEHYHSHGHRDRDLKIVVHELSLTTVSARKLLVSRPGRRSTSQYLPPRTRRHPFTHCSAFSRVVHSSRTMI